MKQRTITIAFWTLSILAIAGSIGVHYVWKEAGIGVVGSYASVVGLILTGYVAVSVRQVKQRYVRRILLDSNFRTLSDKIAEFGEESTADGLRILAASISQLLKEVSLHLPHGVSVELPIEDLKSLSEIRDGRAVLPAAKTVRPKLSAVVQAIEILRVKDDWGRDDG